MTAFAASRLVVSLLLLVCDCGQLQSVVFLVLLWFQYVMLVHQWTSHAVSTETTPSNGDELNVPFMSECCVNIMRAGNA